MKFFVLLVIFAIVASASAQPDVVQFWNANLDIITRAAAKHYTFFWSTRNGAEMHIAQHDCFSAINGVYRPYTFEPHSVPSVTSVGACANEAAFQVLLAEYPGQQSSLQAMRTAGLAAYGGGGTAQQNGIALGQQSAAAILNVRSSDGAVAAGDVTYIPQSGTGFWQPDPNITPTQSAIGAGWGSVTYYTNNAGQTGTYPVQANPGYNSQGFINGYTGVQAIGQQGSLSRTADQSQQATFWAYDFSPFLPFNVLLDQTLRAISTAAGLGPQDNARMFALAYIAEADSSIASLGDKYNYQQWRPETAIRAGGNGNPQTPPTTGWLPFGDGNVGAGINPAYPSYPSAHASVGSAGLAIARAIVGDTLAFQVTSDEIPSFPRTYATISQAIAEIGNSRVYAGLNFQFDVTTGSNQGLRIANVAISHYLTPDSQTSSYNTVSDAVNCVPSFLALVTLASFLVLLL